MQASACVISLLFGSFRRRGKLWPQPLIVDLCFNVISASNFDNSQRSNASILAQVSALMWLTADVVVVVVVGDGDADGDADGSWYLRRFFFNVSLSLDSDNEMSHKGGKACRAEMSTIFSLIKIDVDDVDSLDESTMMSEPTGDRFGKSNSLQSPTPFGSPATVLDELCVENDRPRKSFNPTIIFWGFFIVKGLTTPPLMASRWLWNRPLSRCIDV